MSGAWSQQNLLALGSEDKSITISNAEGDTVRQTSVRNDPVDMQFSEMKTDERSHLGENTVNDENFVLFYNTVGKPRSVVNNLAVVDFFCV